MKKFALPLTLAAAAALAACATESPPPAAPVYSGSGAPVTSGSGAPVVAWGSPGAASPVTAVPVIRPGTGTVEAVSAIPSVSSASGASSAPAAQSRLTLRMADGTLQIVDYNGRDITVGQRVDLTADGLIRRI